MTTTFIPGYHTELTINLVDVGIYGNVLSFRRQKTAPPKPVFGSQTRRAISGMISGGLTASGHLAAEGPLAALNTALETETPLAYEIQMGEDSGDTDLGTFSGDLILTGLEISADAEGEWEWNISAELDGDVTYTAPV